jgi:molybdopterin-binding protein
MAADMAPRSASEGPQATTVTGEGLRVTYGRRCVLDVPSITLPSAQTYALLGASGAGKSTLLRILGLLERPTKGTVLYDGRRVGRGNLTARRRIAAVFQKPYLLRGTVMHNVEYGLRLRHVPRAERRRRSTEALTTVGLAGSEKRSALTLSGGEAQRVALARALVLRPTLLLLDEPLSYLDPLLKRDLTNEFATILSSEGVTALYVTHDQDEAAVVADRIGVMREGRIVTEGTANSVLTLPQDPWVASFLGTEPPLEGTVVAVDRGAGTVRCAGCDLMAATDLPVGTRVHVGVRPEDVLLFESGADLPASSALNRLDATVTEVTPSGVTVRVISSAGGCRFPASVTRVSAEALGLAPGTSIVLVFKATAVRVEPVDVPQRH